MKHKIKGDIISWNSSIWEFTNLMKNVKEDEDIELEINSYGGDVFLGIDLCNTLRGHKGDVTVTITGIAASAASVIAMGADKIKIYNNAQMMVHNAWTIAMGNSKELRKVAEDLESINESVLASYTSRLDADTAQKLLDDETYLSATKAKEHGLVDEIIGDAEVEKVESKIFENKAKEFNNKIEGNKQPIVAASSKLNFEEIQAELKELRVELGQLKYQNKPKESSPEPVKNSGLSKLFLNLN
ncbi:Clp protease ClpP [Rossellomorea vietnamensis]|uniref:ATP-dependent Clp protease proteolytic subunit n=1 Tax=Rossellomorea vietnamensis TaxID=218284 RepID=A0A5D4KDZ5_9BACI|nr:head maturation protease, ClpP-related [Rossellomorea vietnamensis]TYR75577.1 Clp protease ClpP [Rossellomorea vietnamensis]